MINGHNIRFTDSRGKFELIVEENIPKAYNIVLFVIRLGAAHSSWFFCSKFLNRIFQSVPILIVVTHCENEESLDDWVIRNKLYLDDAIGSYPTIGVVADSKILSDKIELSKLSVINSILAYKSKIYHEMNTRIIFPFSSVHIRHKQTGMYMAIDKNFFGQYYGRLNKEPCVFYLKNSMNNSQTQVIKSSHMTRICLSDNMVCYETSILSSMSFEKSNDFDANVLLGVPIQNEQIWKFTACDPNINNISNGTEIFIANSKWDYHYLTIVNDDNWLGCLKNPDVWILEKA